MGTGRTTGLQMLNGQHERLVNQECDLELPFGKTLEFLTDE